jgi:hypothetical protein
MIIRNSLFALGIFLLALDIFGLFKSMRNEALYSEVTPYRNDITVRLEDAKKQFDRKENETDKDYALRECMLFNHAMAHYWKDEDIRKYHMRVPLWENYLLTIKEWITGNKKYVFRNYKKAVERGVGICSQPCTALQDLLQEKGIKADLWDIAGHVVVGVKFNDGSEYTLDPDYGHCIPYGMTAIENNPELARPTYANQDEVYEPGLKDHKHTNDILEEYGKEGNHIYTMAKGFENFSYVAIWIIPFLLVLPWLLKRLF